MQQQILQLAASAIRSRPSRLRICDCKNRVSNRRVKKKGKMVWFKFRGRNGDARDVKTFFHKFNDKILFDLEGLPSHFLTLGIGAKRRNSIKCKHDGTVSALCCTRNFYRIPNFRPTIYRLVFVRILVWPYTLCIPRILLHRRFNRHFFSFRTYQMSDKAPQSHAEPDE